MNELLSAIATVILEASRTSNSGWALFLISLAIIWAIEEVLKSVAHTIGEFAPKPEPSRLEKKEKL